MAPITRRLSSAKIKAGIGSTHSEQSSTLTPSGDKTQSKAAPGATAESSAAVPSAPTNDEDDAAKEVSNGPRRSVRSLMKQKVDYCEVSPDDESESESEYESQDEVEPKKAAKVSKSATIRSNRYRGIRARYKSYNFHEGMPESKLLLWKRGYWGRNPQPVSVRDIAAEIISVNGWDNTQGQDWPTIKRTREAAKNAPNRVYKKEAYALKTWITAQAGAQEAERFLARRLLQMRNKEFDPWEQLIQYGRWQPYAPAEDSQGGDVVERQQEVHPNLLRATEQSASATKQAQTLNLTTSRSSQIEVSATEASKDVLYHENCGSKASGPLIQDELTLQVLKMGNENLDNDSDAESNESQSDWDDSRNGFENDSDDNKSALDYDSDDPELDCDQPDNASDGSDVEMNDADLLSLETTSETQLVQSFMPETIFSENPALDTWDLLTAIAAPDDRDRHFPGTDNLSSDVEAEDMFRMSDDPEIEAVMSGKLPQLLPEWD